jgi:hypothetical protein
MSGTLFIVRVGTVTGKYHAIEFRSRAEAMSRFRSIEKSAKEYWGLEDGQVGVFRRTKAGHEERIAFKSFGRVRENPSRASHTLLNIADAFSAVNRDGSYHAHLKMLRNPPASGVYAIIDAESEEVLYVGESHTGRLYDTITAETATSLRTSWRSC